MSYTIDKETLQKLDMIGLEILLYQTKILIRELKDELEFKAGYNPNQLRTPAGHPNGGQWTSDDISSSRKVHSVEHTKKQDSNSPPN